MLYLPKAQFESDVISFCNEFGGIVNAHLHGDRAYTRRDEYYKHIGKSVAELGKLTLPEKQKLTWALHNGIAFTPACIEERMERWVQESMAFGVVQVFTTADITYNTKLTSLEIAEKLKAKYAGQLDIQIGAYNPSGFRKGAKYQDRFQFFEEAAQRADFLVGLAEKDRNPEHIGERQHNFYILQLAARLKKPVQFHVGQENRPTDNTLELLLDDIEIMQDLVLRGEPLPQISAVHAISSSCKSQEEFDRTLNRMKERGIALICCPRAAISMLQDRNYSSPTHNSIARVWDFAMKGIPVSLGVDNLDDIYIPASSADVYDEAEDLANSLRFYDPRILAKLLCAQPLDDFDRGTLNNVLFNGKK